MSSKVKKEKEVTSLAKEGNGNELSVPSQTETKANSVKMDTHVTPGNHHGGNEIDEGEEHDEHPSVVGEGGVQGHAAALAAASGTTEMSASFKNFRHHPDMENFYRFIYENDLRQEALAIIDEIMHEKHVRRQLKMGKVHTH